MEMYLGELGELGGRITRGGDEDAGVFDTGPAVLVVDVREGS